jgi:cystathionine gamma-synthase
MDEETIVTMSDTDLPLTEQITTHGNITRAVHSGANRIQAYDALTTPIIQTATYTFRNTQDLIDFMERKTWGDGDSRGEYGRYGNPTISAVEKRIAAFLLTIRPAGSHIVMTSDCYRRTRQFCLTYLKRFGIETTVVPNGDYDALEQAIIPKKTRIIISESPTNPYLRVVDLPRLVSIAKAHRVLTLIDSTFATPINQRPIEWGIDFVLHSATKYFSGHNDLLAGVIVGRKDRIKALHDARGVLGGVVDPQNAYLLERGIKTKPPKLWRNFWKPIPASKKFGILA